MNMEKYRGRYDEMLGNWIVEQQILCINGLSAWFMIAMIPDADESEMGYTDGAIGTAEERATRIAEKLNNALG